MARYLSVMEIGMRYLLKHLQFAICSLQCANVVKLPHHINKHTKVFEQAVSLEVKIGILFYFIIWLPSKGIRGEGGVKRPDQANLKHLLAVAVGMISTLHVTPRAISKFYMTVS